MNFELSDRTKELQKEIVEFMKDHVYPLEKEIMNYAESNPYDQHPAMNELKAKAKSKGLWNLFLPEEYGDISPGLTNVEYATLAEEMGKVIGCSEIFNCSPPDTGNMEVLAKYGSEEQKNKWLYPLLEGEIRSAFLMTEPDVASSDARNIQTSIVKEGNQYVINGTKWWSSNVRHPDCKFFIVMGKTDPSASTYHQQSMVIVPIETSGITIVRNLPVLNYYDAPYYHCEVSLDNVRVPSENLILGEGRGFEIAQGRLGPGRIHHAMRLIGKAQRALDYMCRRAHERVAFGKSLAEMGHTRQLIAKAFCDVQQSRLLTLLAADKIDRVGAKEAKDLIAAIKITVPLMTCRIVDQAMQLFGAKGMSNDTPLASFYANSRAMRIADGPEEVHAHQLGRNILKEALNRPQYDTQYFE